LAPLCQILNTPLPTVFYTFNLVSVAYLIYSASFQKCQQKLNCIPITLVKSCSNIFGVLLLKLANLSFTEGIFSDQFTLGQGTPIPKKHGLAVDDPSKYSLKKMYVLSVKF